MRKFWGLAVLLLLNMSAIGSASAASELQVVVHAQVPPARYIILSSDNQIAEIISNTPLSVAPRVYAGSVTGTNQRPLTTALYTEYLFLLGHVANNKDKIGILYKASPSQTLSHQPQVAYLSDKSQTIQRLFFTKTLGVAFHA